VHHMHHVFSQQIVVLFTALNLELAHALNKGSQLSMV
jgi:hypothetical protein